MSLNPILSKNEKVEKIHELITLSFFFFFLLKVISIPYMLSLSTNVESILWLALYHIYKIFS